MKLVRLAIMICVIAAGVTPAAGLADTISQTVSLGERATLQAAMQRHIEANLVDGRFLHLDAQTGAVTALKPGASHPKILSMGEYFVLCAEFSSPDGAPVNVDFFLARRGKGFAVFSSQVENRKLIARLMQSGTVSPVQ